MMGLVKYGNAYINPQQVIKIDRGNDLWGCKGVLQMEGDNTIDIENYDSDKVAKALVEAENKGIIINLDA